MRRFMTIVGLMAVMMAGVLASSAVASGPSSTSGKPTRGKLKVGVKLKSFKATNNGLTAQGEVRARLSDGQGHTKVIRQKVTLTAKAGGGNCRVLHLRLDKLDLTLLGLNAHLDKVILDVTGQRKGGVLGRLFCQLADTRVGGGKRQAIASRMTSKIQHINGEALRFSTYISPKATTSASGSCRVLDLVVGPLNLDLLGLVVDLNEVHLSITANRGQGALGDLFCTLADNNTSGGTTTTP